MGRVDTWTGGVGWRDDPAVQATEERWARERRECLARWLAARAAQIAALPERAGRRAAIERLAPGAVREELQARVREIWARRPVVARG
jgi:hypothetical protein